MKRSPIVYLYFFISGITALVYEILWTRMLTIVFGHTVYSVSIVLAAFMAGLGAGSYLWGHCIDRLNTDSKRPQSEVLLIYGTVEVLIALAAVVISLVIANFSTVFSAITMALPEWTWLQNTLLAVLAFGLMVVPTTLMGATLPLMTKYFVVDENKMGSQVGVLYFINTFGAALGCLLTGFFLVSAFGVLQTAMIAAGLNLLIGLGAIRVVQEETGKMRWFRLPRLSWPGLQGNRDQYLWMALSAGAGFTALAYEVLWTRLLVFSISSTVYSFSMMLSVFLTGIALGSLLAAQLLKRVQRLRLVLIVLQCGIGFYVVVSLYSMESLLSPPWNSYNLQNAAQTFGHYLTDSLALMLFPTLLLGMTFPILIRLITQNPGGIGEGTGRIYSANTLGAIAGSLVTGFALLPWLGSARSFACVAAINFLMALTVFWSGDFLTRSVRKGLALGLGVLAIAVSLAIPSNVLESFFMRDSVGKRNTRQLLFFEEGLTDTVAIFKDNYGILDPTAKRLITNGISMSASNKTATRYMKLFAHVPILLSDVVDEVLVICFGTGQTTGAAGIHPRVKNVDGLELSPSVINGGGVFAEENHDVLNNPKVHMRLQDGRTYLLTTNKTFDVITGEPPPPRTAFTVNLYTREFYEEAARKLKPGGIMTQWVPLHSQSAREVDMHFRTFLSVFPHAIAWMSVANEILLIGSDQPIELDFEKIRQRMQDPVVRDALKAIHIDNPFALLSNIWFFEDQMRVLGAGRPLITDNRPFIEFYLEFPGVIKSSGLERLIFSRASFEEVTGRIKNLPDSGLEKFKKYYEAMDFYQRGVLYGDRRLLLEAVRRVEDDGLFRYHLQAGTAQMQGLIESIEKDPNDLQAMLNLGHAYYQVGEYDQSMEVLNRVLEKDPNNSFARLYLAYDWMEKGNHAKAKEYFEATVKKDPRQLNAVMQDLGLVGLLSQLKKDPDNLDLLNSAAQLYNVKNDYKKSLEYSFRAFEKDPTSIQALQSIVFSYRGLGNAREVFDYGQRYRLLNPDDLQIQYILGEMYLKTLRCEKAMPYFDAILKENDAYKDVPRLKAHCERELSAMQSAP